jgi:hypothetical protein
VIPPEQVDALAARIADRLEPRLREIVAELSETKPASAALTVAEVAHRLNVSEDYVRRNAAKLGATRLGDGPKARLRFDPAKIERFHSGQSEPVASEPKRKRPRQRKGRSADLLPIKRLKGGRYVEAA